jgi:FkbM family methyltransferase
MSLLTSPFMIRVRAVTRRLGLNKLVGNWLARRGYEDRFGKAFTAQIRPGDLVWDVGANIGLYTGIFAGLAKPGGKVVAFEPAAACVAQLRGKFEGDASVRVMNVALGDAEGTITMEMESDPLASTHRVVAGSSTGAATSVVEVKTAQSVVAAHPELFPSVVKIDVEGHEGAVLDGMQSLLADRRLRCVGIEVHFTLLGQRGEHGRPAQMQERLESSGFTVSWTDPSHLLATR